MNSNSNNTSLRGCREDEKRQSMGGLGAAPLVSPNNMICSCCCYCIIALTALKKYIYRIYLAAPGLSCGLWHLVPWPGIRPGPLHWERGVLAAGPPGKSLWQLLYVFFVFQWSSVYLQNYLCNIYICSQNSLSLWSNTDYNYIRILCITRFYLSEHSVKPALLLIPFQVRWLLPSRQENQTVAVGAVTL